MSAVELVALDWLRALLGLPEGAEGLMTSGGSLANLTALAAARAAAGPGVCYLSDQTHASIMRALSVARLCGRRGARAADRRRPAPGDGGPAGGDRRRQVRRPAPRLCRGHGRHHQHRRRRPARGALRTLPRRGALAPRRRRLRRRGRALRGGSPALGRPRSGRLRRRRSAQVAFPALRPGLRVRAPSGRAGKRLSHDARVPGRRDRREERSTFATAAPSSRAGDGRSNCG